MFDTRKLLIQLDKFAAVSFATLDHLLRRQARYPLRHKDRMYELNARIFGLTHSCHNLRPCLHNMLYVLRLCQAVVLLVR